MYGFPSYSRALPLYPEPRVRNRLSEVQSQPQPTARFPVATSYKWNMHYSHPSMALAWNLVLTLVPERENNICQHLHRLCPLVCYVASFALVRNRPTEFTITASSGDRHSPRQPADGNWSPLRAKILTVPSGFGLSCWLDRETQGLGTSNRSLVALGKVTALPTSCWSDMWDEVSLEDVACFVHLALFWRHPGNASLSIIAYFKLLVVYHYPAPEMNIYVGSNFYVVSLIPRLEGATRLLV
jgi:hypothetical protein